MKIVCIGGGPAGLYFAISMKLRDPAHEVLVVERNRPDDTFGWGVVFSNETLDRLWKNDAESAAAIEDSFQHWDDIDVHFKGHVVRSGGHGFAGAAAGGAGAWPAGRAHQLHGTVGLSLAGFARCPSEAVARDAV